MKLSSALHSALNKQITVGLTAEHTYLSMAAWFDSQDLEGFANYFKKQAEEERMHAMKIYGYLNDRMAAIKLGAIPLPKASWKSVLDATQDALKNEEMNTKALTAIMNLAKKEADHATESFLQWFMDEQVEEEASADLLISKVKLVGNGLGVYELDKELMARKE